MSNPNLNRKKKKEAVRRRNVETQEQLRQRIETEAEQRRSLNEAHREWQEADEAARAEATQLAGDPAPKPSLKEIHAHRRATTNSGVFAY